MLLFLFQKTFHDSSGFWSNKNSYNLPGGKTGFDDQETKLPTYWNTSFSKICLGMKIGQQIKFIVINKKAASLHSLIADGKYRATSLGCNTWKKLIGSQASLQTGCNKGGSMLPVPASMLRQESVSLEMTNEIATPVIPKLGLEREEILTIPTHVGTTLSRDIHRIMERETSKPWDISWYSRLSSIYYYLTVHEKNDAIKGFCYYNLSGPFLRGSDLFTDNS